jgi:hypothetical protein
MKTILRVLILLVATSYALAHAKGVGMLPKFSDYSVDAYRGPLRIPSYYKKDGEDWRDDMGKLIAPPAINFAGKYYIGIHSCGADCRYYSISDLADGSESNALDMFSNDGSHPQKTSDGRSYIVNLLSRPTSNMLVAQYHIEQNQTSEQECRERVFLLRGDGKQVKSITGTISFCEKYQ